MEEEPTNNNRQDTGSGRIHLPRKRREQFTRTRNGCERCRARRRKCDEGKPQCQRCMDAKAECQYITRMSFPYGVGSIPEASSASSQIEIIDHAIPLSSASSEVRPADALPNSSPGHSKLVDGPIWNTLDVLPEGLTFLLNHYNRSIAPWLDIYDHDHTFANLVPRLGMTSPPVLRGILRLSVATSGRYEEVPRLLADSALARRDFHLLLEGTGTQALQVSTAFALEKVEQFMEAVPDSWVPTYSWDGGNPTWVLVGFDHHSHANITLAVAALMSRLDIAYALVHQTAPAMDSAVLQEAITAYSPQESESDGTYKPIVTALRCIAILTDVIKLCFEPPDQGSQCPAPSAQARADKWRKLMTDLLSWYSNRGSSMKSLIEGGGPTNTFPAIVFTSAAALWANMMYHVSMLVLITHKPASISLRSEFAAAEINHNHFSSQWHAQRVSGIAINSNPRCWDPCMIGAFYLAAQRMTQITQQKELLACLERIGVAGWRIEGLAARLRDEWCLPVVEAG